MPPINVFATLTPLNLQAKESFHKTVQKVRTQNTTHHIDFMHIEEERRALAELHEAPEGDDSDYNTNGDTNSPAESATDSKQGSSSRHMIIWHGHYYLSMDKLPSLPAAGWRIGRGRFKIGSQKWDPLGGVDILVSASDVRGLHARLSFDKLSGLLLLKPQHDGPSALSLDGETIESSSRNPYRTLNKRTARLRIGALEFLFAYCLEPGSPEDMRFTRAKTQYFARYLKAGSPPLSMSATPSETDISVCGWVLRSAIGSGSFGTVSAASDPIGRTVAVKTLTRKDARTSRLVDKEINAAQSLTSILENSNAEGRIMRLERIIYQRGKPLFDNGLIETVWILYTPLVRGTFSDLTPLEATGRSILFFKQVLEGLDFLHSHRWVHRDIKPANLGIMSFHPPRAVILDLGSARLLPESGWIDPRPGAYGTPMFVAPEIETRRYNGSVDMWSLGVVGCELFLGRHPWTDNMKTRPKQNPWLGMDVDLTNRALENFQVTLKILRESTEPICSLVLKMLAFEPYNPDGAFHAIQRISASKALEEDCLVV